MRIDIFSIFPQYLEPLRLSLVGKAVADGLIDLAVHDLRDFAHDRHRTVDDAPFGGGPGMVMSPQPWGEAIDSALSGNSKERPPHGTQVSRANTSESDHEDGDVVGTTLIVPTPAGQRLAQAEVEELAGKRRLLFACGRYEGIDQRVVEHYRSKVDVREISIGDYVLAGGEVAALVMVEAVARLLPGVLGNADSARQDSFAAATEHLLEAPQYTRPRIWRDLEVPEVLLSGDHGRIEQWRADESRRRTAAVRPDLLDR